jgi:hypothetical protein
MADRTWNGVDARILDEDWSRMAILVCEQILIKCPNQYGVYTLPRGSIKRFFEGLIAPGHPSVDDAIQELAEDGVIKLYGEIVWIVKKWGRDKYSKAGTNRKGAIDYVAEHYPEVAPDFEAKYPLSGDLVRTKTLKTRTSDSESDSDTDPERPKKVSRKKISPSESNPEYIALVLELFPPDKYPSWTNSQRGKHVDALDKLIRVDGFTQEEVFAILRWMRRDSFWNANFQSIIRLREKGAQKYLTARGQWKKSQTEPTLKGMKKRLDDDLKWVGRPTGEVNLERA